MLFITGRTTMIPVEEFQKENDKIIELCEVLKILVQNEDLRSNGVVCELLDGFMSRVGKHMAHEDRSIYGDLLAQHTPEAKRLASHFLGNTQELKRICKSYKKDWCQSSQSESDHDQYVKDSMDIFRLVCDRIDFETNKIFPIFKDVA